MTEAEATHTTEGGADAGPAVLIMARAPRAGQVRRALEPLLGPAGCAALQAAALEQAARWARAVGAGSPYIAADPPDAGPELSDLAAGDAIVFPQNGDGIAGRLADAAGRVFARGTVPLLIVWPDLPRLRDEHAAAALDDLTAGCDVVLGPVLDGGFYLIGLQHRSLELFCLPEQLWRGRDTMALAAAAVRQLGAEVGVLRAERGLHRPADVRAALADPLLPEAVSRVLRAHC